MSRLDMISHVYPVLAFVRLRCFSYRRSDEVVRRVASQDDKTNGKTEEIDD